MINEFLKIKDRPYFFQELNEFIGQLQLMGISNKKHEKLKKIIMRFLLKVKENIYREVERIYYKEDVMTKIKEYYGMKGLSLAKSVPDEIIDLTIDAWQDNLGNLDTHWEINWMVLEDVLYCESWLKGIKEHNRQDVRLYKYYLKDWYSMHSEGEPVCIDEFMSNEMQDQELKKYYLGLAKRKTKKRAV